MIVRLRRLHADDRGSTLVETLVASALLGIALIGLVGSLSTFAIASRGAEDRSVAQSIARAQAARIHAAPYRADGDYSAYDEALPAGYSRTFGVTWWDGVSGWTSTQNGSGLQKINLGIRVNGSRVATLEFVKADR